MNKVTAALVILIVIMASTTPSREDHLSGIEAAFMKELKSELKPKSGAEMIGVGFASMLGGGLMKGLLSVAEYNHYLVLSTMTLPARRGEDKELLTLGVMGQIILMKELE